MPSGSLEFEFDVPEEVTKEVDFILGACPGTVFYNADGDALILGEDCTWIARVAWDAGDQEARTYEAWLSTIPIESYLGPKENEHVLYDEDLPELQGFETGFSC